MRALTTCLLLLIVALSSALYGHELRPAYLQLTEIQPGQYDVLWKRPMLGDAKLKLDAQVGNKSLTADPIITRTQTGALIETWTVSIPSLRGSLLDIRGLASTLTDTLVRVEFLDGTTWTERLTPKQPSAKIPVRTSRWNLSGLYLGLGVEHILIGTDHLLFVLGLFLLVGTSAMLLKTITAFTIAHSITLALATLQLISLPSALIEALIAASILILGTEIIRLYRGESTVCIRKPWLVAFLFGLLHGMGFSSALREAGLPETDLPLALLNFNLGVEAGQLAFVTGLTGAQRLLKASSPTSASWLAYAPAYSVGSIGAYWTLQRTLVLVGVSV